MHHTRLTNFETGEKKTELFELASHVDPIQVVFAQCSTHFQLLQIAWPKIQIEI